MKKFVFALISLVLLLSVCVNAVTETAVETTADNVTETTTELNEPEPETEVDTAEKTARDFLNINLYLFAGAVVLLVVCTVIHLVLKSKKKKS